MQAQITAVISFCSNDWRFIKRCIAGVSYFCSQVIVTVCDHFFDGSKENYALLEEVYRCFPECTFLEFNFNSLQTYRRFSPFYPEHHNWRHEWHNTGRWLSYFYSSKKTDFLFFLDCDEIVDPQKFKDWLANADLANYTAYRFAGFWYFREAKFEALPLADLCLLVKKETLIPDFLWDEDERMGIYQCLPGEKKLGVLGSDGLPMVRHYGGVRPKEEMEKKYASWGHHWERDWKYLVEEEFSRPFNGKDFVRHYQYREVKPAFDPLSETAPQLPEISFDEHLKHLHRFPNVIMVGKEETFKRQLEYEFTLGATRHDH